MGNAEWPAHLYGGQMKMRMVSEGAGEIAGNQFTVTAGFLWSSNRFEAKTYNMTFVFLKKF